MSVSLNPITLQKLDQFDRRRRRLVLARGICAALVSFLLLMTLIATADWLWVLSSSARWTMSIAGYLGVGLVVWLTCIRLLIHIPSRRELGQFVEETEPILRERLLSAIELCADDPSQVHDSPAFRQLLQDHVGQHMAKLEIPSLLPLRLLSRWMAASAALALLFAVLLLLPGLPFRQLLTRAILPGANLDRVSRVHVSILQPTPHSFTMPRDETVAVIVEISGSDVDVVTLETLAPSGQVLRQPMRVHGPMQFAANIAVEEESVDYRILAGDAVTRRYTIRSRPRPHVVAYHKTYRPPAYSRMPKTTLTETHGDLVALQGTNAEIVFELDQPVAEADLRLERNDSEEVEIVTLVPAGPLRYRAELPMAEPGIYRTHLVAEETGFDNPFSPKHEIRPEPDLIPQVGFVGIEETTLLLPPNDILDLVGLAEDDLPLVALEQQISVNGRTWQSVPLSIDEEPRVTVDWQWDMLDLNLKSGDQVATKLVATDRKGHKGESIPLHIVVSSPDFDPDRHTVMELKGTLYDRLAELAAAVRGHSEAANTIVARLREDPAVAEIPQADRSVLIDLTHKLRDQSNRVATRIVELLPKMPAGADSDELELVARVVARIQYGLMRIPPTYLDLPRDAAQATATGEDLKRIGDAFQKSADDAHQLEERYRNLLTHNILAAIAADLNGIQDYQTRVLNSGTLSWQRLLRQETVVTNQLRVVEQLIRKHLEHLAPQSQQNMPRYVEWVSDRRLRLESTMESEDQLPRLQQTATQLANDLVGQQNIATSDGSLPQKLVEARRDFNELGGSLAEPIKHLADVTSQLKSITARLAETGDSVETQALQTEIERAGAQLASLQANATDRLTSRRTATQSRNDSDSQYASDAGLTRRALGALIYQLGEEPLAESEIPDILAKIAPAYRILEAGHEVIQLDMALTQLLMRERWDSQRVTARLDHPRQWDAIQKQAELVSKELRTAKFPDEIAGRIDGMRWSRSVQDANQKIASRRWIHNDYVAAAYELAEMKTDLETPLADIEPVMAEARALIAQYVPTVPEMARQAAEELRELEQQTDATADALADTQPPQAAEQMDRVEQRQEQANQQLEDLLDALVEDANQQDMMEEEGRQRARDADDSMRMIEEPAAQMNQAMEQAAAAQEIDEQALELSKAADQQERTADALDKIAEHYERLERGEDVAESREALRQAEHEMGIARQMDQQYNEAEQLAEMAAKSPQQLIAELEAELNQNPAMQEALSEISQDALAQARNSLKDSAGREAEMERAVERSDQDFRDNKQAFAEQLRELGRQANDLANRQANQAESSASRGKAQEARDQVNAARNQLYQEVAKAQHANVDAALEDLVDLASQTAKAAAETAEKLRNAEQLTASAKDENIHDNEARRAEQQRRSEEEQKRLREQLLREAKDRALGQQRQVDQTKKQVDQEQRDLDKAQQEADRRAESLRADPENESAQRSMREAEQRRQQAQTELQRAQRVQQRAEQRRQSADKAVEQLEKQELKPLEAPNPDAELANRLAQEAAELAERMAEQASQLAAQPAWAQQLTPEYNTLNDSRERQHEIGTDVDQAGEDVARAGRHEERLDKTELAQQLAQTAQDIQDVAEGEVAQSERQLGEATEEADPQNGPPQSNQQALEAHASIGIAEDAIAEQAEALDATLNPPEPSQTATTDQPSSESSPSQEGSQSASQSTPEQAARGQMLARTLDALDQALAASQSSPSDPGTSQPTPSPLAQAAQAQAAQMAQARMQARMAAQKPGREGAIESKQGAALVDRSGGDATLQPVARTGDEWGQLRSKSAEDTVGSGSQEISAEYRKQVETYFRVIAERARKKK